MIVFTLIPAVLQRNFACALDKRHLRGNIGDDVE
jgi:hypothetical protein